MKLLFVFVLLIFVTHGEEAVFSFEARNLTGKEVFDQMTKKAKDKQAIPEWYSKLRFIGEGGYGIGRFSFKLENVTYDQAIKEVTKRISVDYMDLGAETLLFSSSTQNHVVVITPKLKEELGFPADEEFLNVAKNYLKKFGVIVDRDFTSIKNGHIFFSNLTVRDYTVLKSLEIIWASKK